MAKLTLPKLIEPLRLVERGAVLQGKLKLQDMLRLSELLAEKTGDVQFQLQFEKDAQGLPCIYGRICCQLVLACQRCLRSLPYYFDLVVKLCPVLTDAAAGRLPEGYEPLIVAEEPMPLSEIIEDELLLNMPIVARHEQCPGDTGNC